MVEEHRFLSGGESELRMLCKEKLAQLLKARAAYWKQRSKFRVVCEAHENTKFHHAYASHKLRKNQIKALEVHGIRCTRHVDKAKMLNDHFMALLGAAVEPVWDFDISAVYNNMVVVNPEPLVAPFTTAEVLAAVKSMNSTSALGLDGFCPSFYCSSWGFVKTRPELPQLLL
jgi:hypothetical protein